jgi:hypothetical protein
MSTVKVPQMRLSYLIPLYSGTVCYATLFTEMFLNAGQDEPVMHISFVEAFESFFASFVTVKLEKSHKSDKRT